MNSGGTGPVYLDISRKARIPDPVRLARFEKNPELGPRILFFSGGSALRQLSSRLIRYSHNSIHIITPFDSGGSSAELRKAFRMPAVGDIRNRLLALADPGFRGAPHIYDLFNHRLPFSAEGDELISELEAMARGQHPMLRKVPEPMRGIIRGHIRRFLSRMPKAFDLRGASIGNLVLAAGYLEQGRRLDQAIYTFSNLVQVRGSVRPVVDAHLHLVAELVSGEVLVGQHLLTGKETTPISAPVRRIYLSKKSTVPEPHSVRIRPQIKELIASAELICYPFGSFYSSLIANLIPTGVGSAVSNAVCPKIYIPNPAADPESHCLGPTRQVEILLSQLQSDAPGRHAANRSLLDAVIIDKRRGLYSGPVDENRLGALGIEVINYPLISEESSPLVDAERLAGLLVSLS
jgi:CofD-related protein of GAK system